MVGRFGVAVVRCFTVLQAVWNRLLCYVYKQAFRTVGRNVRFKVRDTFSYANISIGNDVYIAPGAVFLAPETDIIIGNKVLFGPNVSIITGDHPLELCGKYIYDMLEKKPGQDLPVVIEDDVWIGTGVIILKGVTVGRGAVVAAGAVVTKNLPRYSICAGVPAKVVRYRGTQNDIAMHEEKLYGQFVEGK